MSGAAVGKVFELAGKGGVYSGNPLMVLVKMADCGHDDGTNIFPGRDHVAACCNIDASTVRRIWRQLEDDGVLVADGDPVGGRGKTRRYRIDFERLAELAAQRRLDKAGQNAPLSDPEKGCEREVKGGQKGCTAMPSEQEQEQEQAAAATHAREAVIDQASTETKAERIHHVGRAVLDAMGVADDPRWLGHHGRVAAWLAGGADPDLDILPTVRRLMDARNGDPPRSLAYFDSAIAEAVAARNRPLPKGEPRDGRTSRKPHPGGAEETERRRAGLAAAAAERLAAGVSAAGGG